MAEGKVGEDEHGGAGGRGHDDGRDAPHGARRSAAPPRKLRVEVLIPTDADHPGAGACLIRNGATEELLAKLDELRLSLPRDTRRPTAVRRFYDDRASSGGGDWVCSAVADVISAAGLDTRFMQTMPFWRFIEYSAGGAMAAHTDGSNRHPSTGKGTTHTMLLYLSSCTSGGETALLATRSGTEQLAAVRPQRGDLLIFPHKCPHVGCTVGDEPKVALRGELISED